MILIFDDKFFIDEKNNFPHRKFLENIADLEGMMYLLDDKFIIFKYRDNSILLKLEKIAKEIYGKETIMYNEFYKSISNK